MGLVGGSFKIGFDEGLYNRYLSTEAMKYDNERCVPWQRN